MDEIRTIKQALELASDQNLETGFRIEAFLLAVKFIALQSGCDLDMDMTE